MAKANATPKDEPAAQPVSSDPPTAVRAQEAKAEEVSVEITDIKASKLPAKLGIFSGLFYIRVKSGQVSHKTKTAKYIKGDDFVKWNDTIKLSGVETSKVEIEVYARRFFFSYKLIKKTESVESLADLLEHSETPIELELLGEGQGAGKLTFRIGRSSGDAARVEIPPVPEPDESPIPTPMGSP